MEFSPNCPVIITIKSRFEIINDSVRPLGDEQDNDYNNRDFNYKNH